MEAYSLGKLIGVIIGFAIGLAIVVVIALICNKNRKMKTEYDERQLILRGRGFKMGFYAMVIWAAFNIALAVTGFEIPMEPEILAFSYIVVGVLTDVLFCIFHDAYWGMNNNKARYLILFALIGGLNLAVAIRAHLHGELVKDGRLGSLGINLFVAFLFVLIGCAVLIQMIREKSEQGGEEEA